MNLSHVAYTIRVLHKSDYVKGSTYHSYGLGYYRGMKVAILGYGIEGKVSADYWYKLGNEITVCDENTDLKLPKKYKKKLGDDYLADLGQFDVLVRTAGLNSQKILSANAGISDIQSKITTSYNEFMQKCPTKNTIGVTGTKGKGTTSTLIAKLLGVQGKTVHLGGNIGIAPLKMLPKIKKGDWVVLELSSFQLSDAKFSPHMGVCLMVVPEHLNWHEDMVDYTSAKTNLFTHQKESDVAIYYGENNLSKKITFASKGSKIPYFAPSGVFVKNDCIVSGYNHKEIIPVSKVKLLGVHNLQNICAALTAVQEATGSLDGSAAVLSSFKGLEHRLEFVRTLGGVKYYDDSFGTTPETAIVASQSFASPKVIILGGSDKGAFFEELTNTVVTGNMRHVVAIGDTGPAIARLLRMKGYSSITEGLDTMTKIVKEAKMRAKKGDVVLLSTGCASFGLFEDYKDRGNQFKQAVKSLK